MEPRRVSGQGCGCSREEIEVDPVAGVRRFELGQIHYCDGHRPKPTAESRAAVIETWTDRLWPFMKRRRAHRVACWLYRKGWIS